MGSVIPADSDETFSQCNSAVPGPDLFILILVVLLLFGSTRIPRLARSLGQAKRAFSEGRREDARPPNSPDPDEKVTLTRAELDALLAEREAKAKPPDKP